MSHNKVVTVFLMLILSFLPVLRQTGGTLYAGDNKGAQKGKEIFHERCAVCHGVDGVSALPDTPEFAKGERLEKSDAELLETIKKGKGIMPAWGDVLPAEDFKDVLSYVRVVAGNKVFDEKCAGAQCHGTTTLPKFGSKIPKSEELKNYTGELDICKACNIEGEISREDLINVIKYIRTLSK
jgi:cytochrome c5